MVKAEKALAGVASSANSCAEFLHLKAFELHRKRVLDGLELRGNDGENRGVDSVELVETSPSAALAQTGEVLTHGLEERGVGERGEDGEDW